MPEDLTAKSLRAWETNARFWDEQMGDESNRFHREVVRPRVSELLSVQKGELVLDIACGNGNYSAYLAQHGAKVVACDYSPTLLSLAQKRQARYSENIEFLQLDVTRPEEFAACLSKAPFDKAVSNMALMDISDLRPLFAALRELLRPDGIFVFATQHPCFVTLTDRYVTPHAYRGEAIAGQPVLQYYFHRSLQELFGLCFEADFVIDGFFEESYGNKERPDIIVVRARKR